MLLISFCSVVCFTEHFTIDLSVLPPLLHALTWSASISVIFHILVLLLFVPKAHNGQFDRCLALASSV